MNLRDLKYFVALAEHLHFGRAAAACFVSQPTLSTQLRKLEEELGVALVERAPRKVMLTPAGRHVAASARRVVAALEQMLTAAHHRPDPATAPGRAGLFHPLASSLTPPLVPGLRPPLP